MADEDVTAVSSLNDSNNLKRKLDDLAEPTSAAAPDSSEVADNNNGGGGVDDDSSKRPRLDEQVSENGHKPEGENGHTKETDDLTDDEPKTDQLADEENAEPQTDAEDAETEVEDCVDGEESAKEVVPGEENEAEPVPETEQKVDAQNDDSKEIDAEKLTSVEVQQENAEKTSEGETHEPASEEAATDVAKKPVSESRPGSKSFSKKIEIPNNKVGVLIGKSGDTIRYLQINSGVKIQITRDADADPDAPSRTVELIGRPDSVTRAEKLIKDVIAEADAGGSPSLVARGFSAALSEGATEIEIPVPGDKVGIIIGRGGDTIRNLQTRSGARIQLVPQNVPGEQQSKEKRVKITGDKRQVEAARELIEEVMNQQPGRPSQFSGNNYNQQNYPPRGPGGAPSQWGGNRGPPSHQMPYDYHQRGPYPSQGQQYPAQPYGNHPYHGPPRSNYGSSWEQRPPAHGPPHSGGYDYYGQGGGHAAGNSPAPRAPHMAGHASGPAMAAPHSQGNYNYGQPRGADYGHQTPYSHTAPPAQNYGHGYGDPKYNAQAPVQQPPYGGAQGYAPPQQGYAPQQQYSRPPAAYGGAPQGGYAPPAATQPTDTSYQAPVSAPAQPHQQYPYAPGPTTQPPYGSAPVTTDAYSQSQQAAGYAQAGAPAQAVAAYGQPGAQPQAQPVSAYGQQAVGYAQTAAPGGYGYQGQVDPSVYGYQGQVTDPSAYAAANAAYSGAPAPAAAQAGYGQPVAAQPGYDQSAAPTGAYPAAAPAAAPGTQPQPQPQPQGGYPQYDASQQMYAAAPRQ